MDPQAQGEAGAQAQEQLTVGAGPRRLLELRDDPAACAAPPAGSRPPGGCQLTDELLAAVIAGVRLSRPDGKSAAWETVASQHEQMKEWLKQGFELTKVHTLLGRRGVVVSHRTLHRYATTELGFGQRKTTVGRL
jgi:hypothetical protein